MDCLSEFFLWAVTSALADLPRVYSLKRSPGVRFFRPIKCGVGEVLLGLFAALKFALSTVFVVVMDAAWRGVMSMAPELFCGTSLPHGTVNGSTGEKGEFCG